MEKLAPFRSTRTTAGRGALPGWLWKRGLILAAIIFAAAWAGLTAFGFVWWQAGLWAAAPVSYTHLTLPTN